MNNKRPSMSELNSQYYSTAMEAQLIYIKAKTEIAKILNRTIYDINDILKIFDDIKNFFEKEFGIENTNHLEKVEEINFFDVIYNDMVDFYNSLGMLVDYLGKTSLNKILNSIDQLINQLDTDINNLLTANNKLQMFSINRSVAQTIPKANITQKILLSANDNSLSLSNYLQLSSGNMFPSSYYIKDSGQTYLLCKDMPPLHCGHLQYQINRFGGIEVRPDYTIDELINSSASDLANKIVCKNIGIDFSNYTDTDGFVGDIEDPKVLILKEDKYYFLCCTDNALELQIPVPNDVINLASAQWMAPATKLQINYALQTVDGVEKNYDANGQIIDQPNNARQRSHTVWNRSARIKVTNNRLLRMSNIELGYSDAVDSQAKDYSRMRPFWRAMLEVMKKQAETIGKITLPPLIIYPVLYESSSNFGTLEGLSSDPYRTTGYVGEYCEVREDYNCDTLPLYLPFTYLALEPNKIIFEASTEEMQQGIYNQVTLYGYNQTYELYGGIK